MNKVCAVLIAICSLVLSFSLGLFFSYFIGSDKQNTCIVDTVVTVRIDTLHDTIPMPTTVFLTRVDTVRLTDTVNNIKIDTVDKIVYVPIERKEYKTDEYYIIIEGYKPSLMLAETYNKTTFQTKLVKTHPRWGIGLQVGGGTDFKRFTPYIGIGVQYNIFTW